MGQCARESVCVCVCFVCLAPWLLLLKRKHRLTLARATIDIAGHVELGHLPAVTGHSTAEWFVQADGAGENLCLGMLGVRGAAGGDLKMAVHAS